MKYIITESRLDDLAYRFVLDRLDGMDFKFKRYKEFSFFPKGTHDADNGIEADWVRNEGYHILIGSSLFKGVRDLFNLTDDQTENAFRKVFIQKGLKKIALLHSLDFSEHRHLLGMNESSIKGYKLEVIIKNYLDELYDIDNLNWTHPYDNDEETGEEGEDETRAEFYIGDYEGEDEGCFRWYAKEYFNDGTEIQQKAPLVQIESEDKKTLDGYFGNSWHEPFKKWFKTHFDFPIKSIIE